MPRSFISHAETIGRRVHWLVDVEIAGYTYRASDEDVTVTDANGAVWRYVAGAGDLSMGVTLDGDGDASVSLSADVQGTPGGWPSVITQDPRGAPATVRRWVEGQTLDEARVMIAGYVDGVTFDGASDPIGFRVVWRSETPIPVPPPQAQISAETWPLVSTYTPDESVIGACYPLVFGTPGFRADVPWGATIKAAYATPAYMGQLPGGAVAYSTGRLVLGWVPDGTSYHATTASVYLAHDDATSSNSRGYAAQSLTVSTSVDLLGRTVATCAPGAYTGQNTTVRFRPGKQYWVRWNNGGGVRNTERTGSMRKAGEVIAYLLRLAGLTVDAGKMAAARGMLDEVLLDFAMVESESDVREIIEDRIGLPIARRMGAGGLWYEAINYLPAPSDAVLHLVAPDHEDDNAGWVETAETTYAPRVTVAAAGPIAFTADPIANTIPIRYAFDRGKTHTQEVIVTGGTPSATRNEIGSVICAASRARYGERIAAPVQLRMVHDRPSAEAIGLTLAALAAYPRRLTTYVGDWADLEVIDAGNIVRVTDRDRRIASKLALVRAVRYGLTTIEIDVEILDYLTHIGSV